MLRGKVIAHPDKDLIGITVSIKIVKGEEYDYAMPLEERKYPELCCGFWIERDSHHYLMQVFEAGPCGECDNWAVEDDYLCQHCRESCTR